jgi:hypothetical protein
LRALSKPDLLLCRSEQAMTLRHNETMYKTLGALEKVSKYISRKKVHVSTRRSMEESYPRKELEELKAITPYCSVGTMRFCIEDIDHRSKCLLEVYPEGFSLLSVEAREKNNLLMISGLTSSIMLPGMAVNLFRCSTNCWEAVTTRGDIPDRARFGHSACYSNGRVWFFGGVAVSAVGRSRKYFNELLILNV